jgi:hypothetical protein
MVLATPPMIAKTAPAIRNTYDEHVLKNTRFSI